MLSRTILTGLVSLGLCFAMPLPTVARSPMPPVVGIGVGEGPAIKDKSYIHGKMVKYGNIHNGYLATRVSTAPAPALVMIHAWWGLNDEVKHEADVWAGRGYAVLAVDLYEGKVAKTPDEAKKLKEALKPEDGVANLESAFQELRANPRVDKNRIAVLGWCMGGAFSLHLAVHQPKLAACVVYYGKPITDPAAWANARFPVVGVFGEDDASIPKTEIDAMKKALDGHKIENDLRTYPKSKHAFANPGAGPNYNPETAKIANQFVEESLAKILLDPKRRR